VDKKKLKEIETLLNDMISSIQDGASDLVDILKQMLDQTLKGENETTIELIRTLALPAINQYKENPTDSNGLLAAQSKVTQVITIIGQRISLSKETKAEFNKLPRIQLKKLLWQKLHEMWAAANAGNVNETRRLDAEVTAINLTLFPLETSPSEAKEGYLFDLARNKILHIIEPDYRGNAKKEALDVFIQLEQMLKKQGII